MKILTTTGVSELLNLHPNTVLRLAKKGELPCTWVGGQHLFVEEEVLEIFKNKMGSDSTSTNEDFEIPMKDEVGSDNPS